MFHAGCWSHAERYFSEAVQLNLQDPVATAIVAQIEELFVIDSEARRQALTLVARHTLRQEKMRPPGLQPHAHVVGEAQSVPGMSRRSAFSTPPTLRLPGRPFRAPKETGYTSPDFRTA